MNIYKFQMFDKLSECIEQVREAIKECSVSIERVVATEKTIITPKMVIPITEFEIELLSYDDLQEVKRAFKNGQQRIFNERIETENYL